MLGMHEKVVLTFMDASKNFNEIQSEDAQGFHDLISETITALGESGDIDGAWALVMGLDKGSLTPAIFERLSQANALHRSPWSVIQVFNYADKEGLATHLLIRKAILAYSHMNMHEKVSHMKLHQI